MSVDRHLLRTAVNNRTASSRQLTVRWSTATYALYRLHQFVAVCFAVDSVQICLYTGYPSKQILDGCICYGHISTEPGNVVDIKLSFQMNYDSICGTMMAALVLNSMPTNAAFQSRYRTT